MRCSSGEATLRVSPHKIEYWSERHSEPARCSFGPRSRRRTLRATAVVIAEILFCPPSHPGFIESLLRSYASKYTCRCRVCCCLVSELGSSCSGEFPGLWIKVETLTEIRCPIWMWIHVEFSEHCSLRLYCLCIGNRSGDFDGVISIGL